MAESNNSFDPGMCWIHGSADFSGKGIPGRPNVYRFVERHGRFETLGNKEPSGQGCDAVYDLFHYHQQSLYHREPSHNPVYVRVCTGNNSVPRSLQFSRKTSEDQPAAGSRHHAPGNSLDDPVLHPVSQSRGNLFYPAGKISRSHRIFRVDATGFHIETCPGRQDRVQGSVPGGFSRCVISLLARTGSAALRWKILDPGICS